MKYSEEVKEIIQEICSGMSEDWMDESDKKEMLSEMIDLCSQLLHDSIQEGISMGYSIDFQMKKAREMLRVMFMGGEFIN